MAMRNDCRHFYRRTVDRSGDRVEGCAVDAAPEAPYSCPANCPFFEKRSLSHTGFVYGSLAPDAPATSATPPDRAPTGPTPDEAALLAELEQIVSDAAPEELARDQDRRRAEDRSRRRRNRKRRD